MRTEITTENTLKEISALSEFAGIGPLLAPSEGPMSEMTLEQFASISCWNAKSIAAGYNGLLRVCEQARKILYPCWNEEETLQDVARTEAYLTHFPVDGKAPFIIVCAGGGYQGCASMIEAYPTCLHMNGCGFHAFALNYRCGTNTAVARPLEDLAQGISYILQHAQELGVDSDHYALAGFSAGGHLVACFGAESVGWKQYGLPRPETLFLGYPVITLGKETYPMMPELFLGEEHAADPEWIRLYSVEEQVTENYPPTYLWQCSRDNAVPVANSQMMASALEKHGVPFVYETFDSDAHGWGAGDDTPAEGWVERAAAFWKAHAAD